MIDLYTWTTPNGRKISVALEEMELDYTVKTINIREDEQFAPDFLKISPNNKIPAIIDTDNGTSVFESGAILIYLAEKSGKFLGPVGSEARAKTLEWLMWQVGGFGPMLGQLAHFAMYREDKIPEAIERFATEAGRLYKVLNTQLGQTEFVAGEYSIADMAIYPWSVGALEAVEGMTGQSYEHVARWHAAMASRAAVERGMLVPVVPET
ncbi:MAG: glutathione S-transferase N-terminal domain-containing protein [Hyphomonadaceae bacterium]